MICILIEININWMRKNRKRYWIEMKEKISKSRKILKRCWKNEFWKKITNLIKIERN